MWRRLEKWLHASDETEMKDKQRSERFKRLRHLKEAVRLSCESFKRKNRFNVEEGECWKLDHTDPIADRLCISLEDCLTYGLKRHGDDLRLTFWGILKQLQSLPEVENTAIYQTIETAATQNIVQTSVGKSRVWIRVALNRSNVLQQTIELLRSEAADILRKRYYDEWSLIRCVEGSGVIVALLSCFSDVVFSLSIDSPELDNETLEVPELRRSNSETKTGIDFDAFFLTMENAVDQVSEKTDNFIVRASRAYSDHQQGIAAWQHVFDVPLEHLVQRPYHCRYALIDPQLGVPNIIQECFEILKLECDTPKLFRTHVSKDRIETAKLYIEKHGALPATCDVHLVASLVLQFFRELPEPLLTTAKHDAFLACAHIEDMDICARNLALLVGELPWAHKPILDQLLELLCLLQSEQHCGKNGLNRVALSIIFAPVLVRVSHASSLAAQQGQEMRLAAIGSGLVERMIQSYALIHATLDAQLSSHREKLNRKKETLGRINQDYLIRVDHTNPEHSALLEKIWSEFDKHQEIPLSFSFYSTLWKDYGFHHDELDLNFNGGGVLFLKCLAYFVTSYPTEALQVMSSRAPEDPRNYSFLHVGALLTQLLGGILQLIVTPSNPKVDIVTLSTQPYWFLLEEEEFFEKLFGFTILLFEHNWRESNALEQHLDTILNETKQQLMWLLERVPKSSSELWRIWLDIRRQQFEIMARSSSDSLGSSSPLQMFSPIASSIGSKQHRFSTHLDEHENEFGMDDTGPVSPIQYSPKATLLMPSNILTLDMVDQLQRALPIVSRGNAWSLLYSTSQHGASLHTLLTLVKRQQPTLLILSTNTGRVFGGYATESWHIDSHYYGTGESFLFSFTEELERYSWSRKNSYFMLCNETSIGMGGGGSFGFLLDADLYHGTSGPCETFDSPCLSQETEFDCTEVEIWTFVA